MEKSGTVVVLLFVAGHAIRVAKGKPARVVGVGRSRLDQSPAMKLATEQSREVVSEAGKR